MGGSNNSKDNQRARIVLLGKCYDYLKDNFHKLTQNNKVRVALELVKRQIPNEQNVQGNLSITDLMKDLSQKPRDEVEDNSKNE